MRRPRRLNPFYNVGRPFQTFVGRVIQSNMREEQSSHIVFLVGVAAGMVRKLKAKNIPAVDLEGSILGWCRSGYPLTTPDGKPTNRVYTYSSDNTVPAAYVPVY